MKDKSPVVVMDTFAISLLCIPLVLIRQTVDIKFSKGSFSIKVVKRELCGVELCS